MSNVVKPKVMQDHSIPVTIQKLSGNMPCHIVVNLSKVLPLVSQFYSSTYTGIATGTTDRNEKARRPIGAAESVWKQLEPRVVAVHDQFPALLRLQLG